MKLRKALAILAVVLFVVPVLAACGGGAPAPGTINVSLTSYKIAPSSTTAPAGSVTFHVKNDATDQTHEFVVVQSDKPSDQLPLDSEGNVDEDQINGLGEVEDVAIGESKDLTLNLAAGHYVLMCNLPGHYQQGMHLDFTVQ